MRTRRSPKNQERLYRSIGRDLAKAAQPVTPRRELCESAKKGHICPDDLCRGNPDDTLCGFDQSFYEELTRESEEPDYDDGPEELTEDLWEEAANHAK